VTDAVIVKKENHICFIKMNQPGKRNALSTELISGLKAALEDAQQDSDIRAIILSGEGKGYCSGGDIESMGGDAGPADSIKYMEAASSLTQTIVNLDKYVISAVHGFAAGAGFSLALASDFIVAHQQTKFISSFRNIGLVPDLGLIKLLAEQVPLPIAKEWVATGKPIQAEKIHSYGLINRLVETPDVVEEAADFAQFIIDGPSLSNKFVKHLFNHSGDISLDTSLVQEQIIQSLMFHTKDANEGIQAFLEKRPPRFTGK